MRRIKVNAGQCLRCGTVIESRHRWDYKTCPCGAVAVDGGQNYLRRVGSQDDFAELSEYEEVEEDVSS